MNGMNYPNFTRLNSRRPSAAAYLKGSDNYPKIEGRVRFYPTAYGTFVIVEATGLPTGRECSSPIFGLHVHSGGACTGNAADPFANAGSHYNPRGCEHPYHAGDMPPLFGADGMAYLSFLTDRFTTDEIIGKTVILHAHPDDFMTQPSGDSGAKIACGVIRAL